MTTAVSGAVALSLVDSGVAPGRVRVIPNGIDIGAIGPHLRSGLDVAVQKSPMLPGRVALRPVNETV